MEELAGGKGHCLGRARLGHWLLLPLVGWAGPLGDFWFHHGVMENTAAFLSVQVI